MITVFRARDWQFLLKSSTFASTPCTVKFILPIDFESAFRIVYSDSWHHAVHLVTVLVAKILPSPPNQCAWLLSSFIRLLYFLPPPLILPFLWCYFSLFSPALCPYSNNSYTQHFLPETTFCKENLCLLQAFTSFLSVVVCKASGPKLSIE